MKPQEPMPANQTPRFREHKRMLKLTLPLLKRRLMRHKLEMLCLVILSLMLGVVPTLKAELEAGVLQQINRVVGPAGTVSSQEDPSQPTRTPALSNIFGVPLERFTGGQPNAQDGIPERLARTLFRNVTLGSAVLAYLVIAIIVFIIELGSKAIQASVSKDLFAKLRAEGMRRGLLTDPSELPAFHNIAGQYAVAIQQGATNVSNTYGYILDAGQYLFALATTVLLVATKSWVFALFATALVFGQVAISVRQARRLAQKRTELDRTRNDLVGRSEDILSKREILVAYEQQDNYAKKLDGITDDFAEVDRKLAVSEQKYTGFSQLLIDYGRILILLLAVVLAFVFAGTEISNVGDAFFLVAIYVRIFTPSSNLLLRYDSIKRSEATSKTFLDVLQLGPEATSGTTDAAEVQWQKGQDIKFSDVSFKYRAEDKSNVLNNSTFRIPAGKTTLILGPSGCGKTTIARLLLKFWPVNFGTVTIGGSDIKKLPARKVRAHMSYVSQGDHIIDDTIKDNLSWGFSNDGISPEKMRRVINLVRIKTPHGYKDILDVPAKELSIGEQQRLSIARMMLDESEIVIMDEPLAGVDVFTVNELLPHLTELLRERNHTVLMISHRLAFAGCADHVIVLNDIGKVEEEGAPEELILRKSKFAELHHAAITELSLSKAAFDKVQSQQSDQTPATSDEPAKD